MKKCRLTSVVLADDTTNIVAQSYIEMLERSKVPNYDATDSYNISLSCVIAEMTDLISAIGLIYFRISLHREGVVVARIPKAEVIVMVVRWGKGLRSNRTHKAHEVHFAT